MSKNQFIGRIESEGLKEKAYDLFEHGHNVKQIADLIKCDRHAVGRWLRKKGYSYSKYNKKEIDSNIFNIVDSEEKAYWLGFIYADGNVTDRKTFELSLSIDDLEHVEKIKSFFKFKGKILLDFKIYRARLTFKDQQIVDDLVKLGCRQRKSLILKFPTEDQIPKKYLIHFIRGYFDGDGHIPKMTKNRSLQTQLMGTYEFLTSICDYFGFDRTVIFKDKRHKNNTFFLNVYGDK